MRGGWGPLLGLMLAVQAGPAGAAAQDHPQVPSGFSPQLFEQFLDVKPDGVFTYARFRFVVPELAKGRAPDLNVLAEDFTHLCKEYALPLLAAGTDPVDKIIISYSDRPVEFGAADPDAKQFFEQFRFENGTCIWEDF